MNQSILLYGTTAITDEQLRSFADKHGLECIVRGWQPTQKFPRMNAVVLTDARPASFNKRDPRIMPIEAAL